MFFCRGFTLLSTPNKNIHWSNPKLTCWLVVIVWHDLNEPGYYWQVVFIHMYRQNSCYWKASCPKTGVAEFRRCTCLKVLPFVDAISYSFCYPIHVNLYQCWLYLWFSLSNLIDTSVWFTASRWHLYPGFTSFTPDASRFEIERSSGRLTRPLFRYAHPIYYRLFLIRLLVLTGPALGWVSWYLFEGEVQKQPFFSNEHSFQALVRISLSKSSKSE